MKVKHSFLILLGILLCASAIQAEPLSDFYNDETLSSRVLALAGENGSYTQDQDLSIHFLRMLFGPVSSLNGYNMIIGKVFELFNYGLLGIVSFIVGYTILTSVIGTAQDGGGAFSTRVSPWTIARTSSGVTLMFPMNSGYSIVQTMVMKIILMGIAFANTGWNAALSHLQERGNSFQVAPVANDTRELQATNTKKAFKFLSEAYLPLYSARHQCITENKCKEGDLINKVESTSYGYEVTFSDNNTYDLPLPNSLYTISNNDDYKNLMDGTLRQTFNSLLTLSDIHKRGRSEDPNTQISNLGEREFGLIYYCPMVSATAYDRDCSKQEGEAYQNIAQKREAVLRKIRSQAEFLAGMAANVIDKAPARSAGDWYSSARKTGWLSSGIYYAKLMGPSGTNANENESSPFALNGSEDDFNIFTNPVLPVAIGDWIIDASDRQSYEVTDKPNSAAALALIAITALKPYMSYTDSVKALIPNLAGKSGGGWVYGVDPTKPIQNFAKMVGQVVQKLVGVTVYDDDYNLKEGCTNDLVNLIRTVFNNEHNNSLADNCVIKGSMMGTMLFPDEVINPLTMIRDLGRTMIRESVTYYSNTIRDLFAQTKKLADGHFAASSVTSGIAAGSEAATAGGPVAPVGAGIGAAAEITISGLKMAFNGTKIAMEMFVPVGTAVAGVFFSLGVLLAVYIPMLPFVLFLFGVVAWLMSVTEAMVAAPLVALGMTHPEGHDLLGKSEQALILLLGVFVRPITMLFGILMAIIASQILVKLFHLSFGTIAFSLLAEGPPGSGEPMTGMAVVAGGVLLVYVYVLMSVIEQSFSLIYVIPERILRWIGGPQDQTGIGQLAEKAKGETQQAAGQVQAASVSGPQVAAVDGRVGSGPESQAEKDDDDSSTVSGKN